IAIGYLHRKENQPEQSLIAFQNARAILEPLVVTHPDSPDLASDLAQALAQIARRDLEVHRVSAETVQGLQRAVELQEHALSNHPNHQSFRTLLREHLRTLGYAANEFKSPNEAASAARRLSLQPGASATDLYHSARILGRCAQLTSRAANS